MGCLYIVSGPSKQYIGITLKTVDERWVEHVASSRRRSTVLHRAIQKYGADAFTVRVLAIADDWSYLCDLERRAIAAFRTKGPRGYNMTGGGDGVIDLCDEAKRTHQANTVAGTTRSWAEPRVREAHKAARANPDYKQRQAAATRASRLWDRPDYRSATLAATRTDSVRAAIAEKIRALWADPEYRANQIAKRHKRKPRSEQSKRAQSEKIRALIASAKANGTYSNTKGVKWDR